MSRDTSHLRFLSSVTLGPTKGSDTLAQATDVFSAYFDPWFNILGADVTGVDTGETQVAIYEITKDGTYADLLSSFGVDIRSLCLSQGQVKRFALLHRELHRELLNQDDGVTRILTDDEYDSPNHLLFEVDGEVFVATVQADESELCGAASRFDYNGVLRASALHRVVVPHLAA